MRFVEIEDVHGEQCPVNAEAVAYLRVNANKHTCIVFGAVQGGLHEVAVKGTKDEVRAMLEPRVKALKTK